MTFQRSQIFTWNDTNVTLALTTLSSSASFSPKYFVKSICFDRRPPRSLGNFLPWTDWFSVGDVTVKRPSCVTFVFRLRGLWKLIGSWRFLREIGFRTSNDSYFRQAPDLNMLSRLNWAESPNVFIKFVYKNGGKIRITIVCSMYIVNIEFQRIFCLK